jgi:flotillin
MGIVLVLVAVAAVVLTLLVLTVRGLLYVSSPNIALIFAGRTRELPTGPGVSGVSPDVRNVGYRLVRGGRSLRVPLLEQVHQVDLTMFTIDVAVQNAYSKGGIPLNVVGVANVKIAGEEPLIGNAIERFLGRERADIVRIAKETLEGNLRGVLAQLTPEQVNEDKTSFAQKLIEEAEHDMHRMGIALDTLKIQNVSDDVGYLNSIGRIRGAVVRREAAIAEANAQSDAAVQKATNTMNAEVARIDADLEIARQQFKKRIADATTKRAAMIAEAEGQVRATVAQVKAEIERQGARVLQVQRQLDAEVIQPAEAERKAAEEKARGEAARILEQGKAQAQSLKAMVEQYRRAGASAREVLALQKLLPLVDAISGAQRRLAVRKLTVLPNGGDGNKDWARSAISSAEQLRAATGIDLGGIARRLASGAPVVGSTPSSTPPQKPGT